MAQPPDPRDEDATIMIPSAGRRRLRPGAGPDGAAGPGDAPPAMPLGGDGDETVFVGRGGGNHAGNHAGHHGADNGNDETVFVGRGGAAARARQAPADTASSVTKSGAPNRLRAAAMELLLTGARLRATYQQPDVAALMDICRDQLARFSAQVTASGVDADTARRASYLLCTFVDESVTSTPWGANSVWMQNTLLRQTHGDTLGGKLCFDDLARCMNDPARHIDYLELFYVALSFGFQGGFGAASGGAQQLDDVKARLYAAIGRVRGEQQRALSRNWRGMNVPATPPGISIPLAATVGIALAVVLLAFIGFLFTLNDRSDDIAWQRLRVTPPRVPATVVAAPQKPVERLSRFLEAEIREGLVEVHETDAQSTVIFQGDGLFDAGSAEPRARYRAVIERVADALNKVPGTVLVTGHTDSQKIRSARFPSNWHLSKARAEAVRDLLAQRVAQADRLAAEGMGDTEPLAKGTTPADLARNRRVEITLRATGVQ